MINDSIFNDLFILELANNHWGNVERGLKIIKDFGQVVRFNNVRAAIKLQFRDVNTFIHKYVRERQDIRYIKKTIDTRLSVDDYAILVEAIRRIGCIPMATPFDEKSVDLCVKFNMPLIKIASSDINDWLLIEKIAKTKIPVVLSTGGSSLKDIDDVVSFFKNRNIPLAILHCVSLYPTFDRDLQLNQIDFLKNRYPQNIIGHSTHEYTDWSSSMLIAYAKADRILERHIDIKEEDHPVSAYCSTPDQIDIWFKSYWKAVEMCGYAGIQKRIPPKDEIQYLDALVRGVYAKRDLKKGEILNNESINEDIYLAVPLQKGQMSCREIMNGEVLLQDIKKDSPITIDMIDTPYAQNSPIKNLILNRGL